MSNSVANLALSLGISVIPSILTGYYQYNSVYNQCMLNIEDISVTSSNQCIEDALISSSLIFGAQAIIAFSVVTLVSHHINYQGDIINDDGLHLA